MAAKAENALVVHVFAYPSTAGGTGPDFAGVRALEGVEVTVKNSTVAPPPAARTDADGCVRFPNLEESPDYKLEVTPPTVGTPPAAVYSPPKEMFSSGRQLKISDKIRMREGGEVLVHVGLTPLAGRVTGTVTAAGADLSGLRVEARVGGRLIDSGTVVSDGATPPTLTYDLTNVDEPGLVEIRPAASFTAQGRVHVPEAGQESRFVFVPPGGVVSLDIAYGRTKAEVRVGANLVEETDGQMERRPLGGVTFRLFRLDEDQPARELTTQLGAASVFAGLSKGPYRLVALAPPSPDGKRLQLTRPPGPELVLQVEDGQRLDLTSEFEFQPVKGSVLGSVLISHDNTPVPGVAVVVTSQQQPQFLRRVLTDQDGEYLVGDLPEGTYRVALEQQVVTALGRQWEQEPLAGTGETSRTVDVRGRATAAVPVFRLTEDEHLVSGQVFGPGGIGAPFVTVQVFDDMKEATKTPPGDPMLNVLTDGQGRYQFRAPAAGTYFIQVRQTDGVSPQLAPVTVSSPATAPPLFTSTAASVPTPAPVASTAPTLPSASQDNDFPFLTQDVEPEGRASSGGRPGGGAGGVGRMVEREIREVLGWRPRAADAKGFQAALQQAFTVREVAGHTEVDWKPRSYSVDIQADLGAITGAQASIHARAKGTLEDVVPLLDGLTALRVDADDENVAAIRAIVRSQLTELVAELGVEGGPRVQRVDQLVGFLLGPPAVDALGRRDRGQLRDPAKVGGSLGVLRDRLGVVRERINTIDEEQNFTNFLVVVDHVAGLAESWDAQRDFFVRGGAVEPFLGTQLVLLSRDLEVIAESVHEVEFAMDSVFLGPAERQTLELRFPTDRARPLVSDSPPLFVSELLSWVERFAGEEGRQLIDEGGRQGVAVAFRPTLELLQALVDAARVSPAGLQDPFRMPAAYRRQRVQRALAELAQQLGTAADRVRLIKPPVEDLVPALAAPPAPPPLRSRAPRVFLPTTDDEAEQGENVVR
jgi:hypothetical protein